MMMTNLSTNAVLGAILYSTMGLSIFAVGFWVFDRLTPYRLWKELIEEKNLALAIVVGSVSIGICIIIASAIH